MNRQSRRLEYKRNMLGQMPTVYNTNNLNRQTYNNYLNLILELYLSRFEYTEVPETMNTKYLEMSLLSEGRAGIALDDSSLIRNWNLTESSIDVYGEPLTFNLILEHMSVSRDITNSVIMYANLSHTIDFQVIHMFAYRFSELERSRDVNLKHMKNPVVFTAPQEKVSDLERLLHEVDNNSSFVLGLESFDDIKVSSINTEMSYKGNDFEVTKSSLYAELYNWLGYKNLSTEKKERLISDEVNINSEVQAVRMYNYLKPRQDALIKINEMFGTNIQIKINKGDENNASRETLQV